MHGASEWELCRSCGLAIALVDGNGRCGGCLAAIASADHDETDRDCDCAGCVLAVDRPIRPRAGLSAFGREVLGFDGEE